MFSFQNFIYEFIMNKKVTRSTDPTAKILGETAGAEHLLISGNRLSNVQQVLLCLTANIAKLQKEHNLNEKITPIAYRIVVQQIHLHYLKANIPIKSDYAVKYQIKKLHEKLNN